MTVFFVVIVIIINSILWLVLLFRFRRLFSTDDIIAKTRKEMNNMIMDINRNTERNINLLEDRTRQLKALIAEADKRINLAEKETERTVSASILQNDIKQPAAGAASVRIKNQIQRAAEKYRKEAVAVINPGTVYELTKTSTGKAEVLPDLFSANEKIDTEKKVVKNVGSSFSEIPIIAPKIYFSEKIVKQEKSFNQKVIDLYNKGLSVDQISKELSCSMTEVQFVLDMTNI